MKQKNLIWQLPFLVFLIVGTVLIIRHQRAMPFVRNAGGVFGTQYHITYQWDEDLRPLIEAELAQVDSALSMFNESSVLSLINCGQTEISQSSKADMFFDVYERARCISAETDGAFDITVAPLVNAWGFGFRHGATPTAEAVDSILRFVGFDKVNVSRENGRLYIAKADARTMLDCSAIAKGYGCDVVARLLRDKGVENFMVEIGGEVVTHGVNDRRVPWTIGVLKPVDDTLAIASDYQTILNVTDKAMATSGNYRNFYYKDGKKYAHTINPKTGRPVQHSMLSATVLASDCATADAYATSFMVMGVERARKVLEHHPELMAYLIYADNDGQTVVWCSPSMKGKFLE